MMKLAICLIILSTLCLFCRNADLSADTLILKNKRSVSGIITEEKADHVVLNVGNGTVVFKRSEIESISKSSESRNVEMVEDWKVSHFENYPAPDPEDQALLDGLIELLYRNREMIGNMAKKESIDMGIESAYRRASDLLSQQAVLTNKIKSVSPQKEAVRYNELILELNSINAKIKESIDKTRKLKEDDGKINENIAEYIDEYQEYKKLFDAKKQGLTQGVKLSEDRRVFYQKIKERLDVLQNDIRHQEVGYSKEKQGIIVQAKLNGRLEARMLVDTGAVMTVISKKTAERLGIDSGMIKQDTKLVLADGRQIPAKYTIMESIKIQDVEAKSVEVVIAEVDVSGGVDGLLGMSFLRKFSFSINAEKQKLIFNYLNDAGRQ